MNQMNDIQRDHERPYKAEIDLLNPALFPALNNKECYNGSYKPNQCINVPHNSRILNN